MEGARQADLGTVVATLVTLVDRAEALRGVVLLDEGDGSEPLVLDYVPGEPVELVVGEESRTVADGEWLDSPPLPLPEVRSFGPLEVDLREGTVQAGIGVLDHLGRAVRDTADVLPGRSVLTVGFETTDPDTPVFFAARRDEPMVIAMGDEQEELPPGWPPA